MAIFYTDTGSINRLEVTGSLQLTGSSSLLNVNGSGSKILVVSGSTGGLLEIGDITANDDQIYVIESGSVQVFKIGANKTVRVTGTLFVSSSDAGGTLLSISGSNTELFKIVDNPGTTTLASIVTGSTAVFEAKTSGVIVSGSLLVSGSVSGSFPNNIRTQRFELGVSSTTTITTGAKGRKTVSYAGTIVGWRLVSDQNTTTTIDIWKTNAAIPTVTNTITGTAKPSLSSAQLNSSTTLTGWTTAVTDGDVFILNVDSNSSATYLALELEILLNNS